MISFRGLQPKPLKAHQPIPSDQSWSKALREYSLLRNGHQLLWNEAPRQAAWQRLAADTHTLELLGLPWGEQRRNLPAWMEPAARREQQGSNSPQAGFLIALSDCLKWPISIRVSSFVFLFQFLAPCSIFSPPSSSAHGQHLCWAA